MKSKDIALIIVSIIAFIELIVILFLIPVKSVEDAPEDNSQWKNITIDD